MVVTPIDPGAAVEVKSDKFSHVWYEARARDIRDDRILVCFEAGAWGDVEVSSSQVRVESQAGQEDFAPKLDEFVEWRSPATDLQPAGWALGVVRGVRGPFFFTSLVGRTRNQDVLAKLGDLRCPYAGETLAAALLRREVVRVPKHLTHWIASEDAAGCLMQVRIKADLLSVATSGPSEGLMVIVLAGAEKSVELGQRLLINVHLKHQAEIQRCHTKILSLRQRLGDPVLGAGNVCIEFSVEDSLVGRVIGKGGQNLQRAQDEFAVKIEVLDRRPRGEPRKRLVKVSGQDMEAVVSARRSVELIHVEWPLEGEQIGWILGKGFKNIQEIASKCGLLYARFNPDNEALEFCGLRDAVESARLLIETHADYLPVYQEMDDEQTKIQNKFEALKKVQKKRSKGGKVKVVEPFVQDSEEDSEVDSEEDED